MAEYAMDPNPANPYTVAVTFTWGAGGVAHLYRYVRWGTDVYNSAADVTYTSTSRLDVEPGKQHGGIEDVPYSVTMGSDVPPCDTLTREYAHAPVAVTVEEFDPNVPSRLPFVLFKGRVSKVTKNARNARGVTKLEVAGWRALLQYPLGPACTRQCQWGFGDENCCKDLGPLRQVVTVTAIDRTLVNASALTMPWANYWTHGTAEYDGLVIDIVDGSSAASLLLKEPPPPEWVGQDVEFTPGCDKELASANGCRQWDNELRFAGYGIAIPQYNPLLGDPGIGTEV